ncbi:hypothetical protein A7K50_12385 [Dehalobacter sp. MCB1]|uniref:hypothetical protein n=1 Tax=Dehalobacter sp. MCB1 TaxID=1844756 RepID=UPI000E6D3A16|nr:hypothetical protein [Dehalobacter sp. MCB1]RJE46816.1 hypothetical protein A7K50_12385 [Dehalobacter sp. MCB1]
MTDSKNWMTEMNDLIDGDFVKFNDGDEKVLKVVSNPVVGPIEFTQKDGSKKINNGLKIEVLVGDNPAIKHWTVTSKGLMTQIKALCRKEGLGENLAGSTLMVVASGTGLQRTYFLKLLKKPAADNGVAWLEGQKAGAQ